MTTGLAQEAGHWLETALADGHGTTTERALAMVLLARFCGLQHDLAPARIWAGQAAEAGVSDNDRAQGLLAVFWAMIAAWDGDLHAAVTESERALALLRSAEDPAGELLAGSIVGVCRGLADQGEAAVSAYQDVIALAAETGEMFRQSFCLAGLGEQALLRGEPERAEELFLDALRAKAELGDRFGVAVALDSVAARPSSAGRARRGAILLGAAASTWDAIGMRETGNPSPAVPRRPTAFARRGPSLASGRSVWSSGAARGSRRKTPSGTPSRATWTRRRRPRRRPP